MRLVLVALLLATGAVADDRRRCPDDVTFLGPSEAVEGFAPNREVPHRVAAQVGAQRQTSIQMCLESGALRVLAHDGTEVISAVLPVNRARIGSFPDTAAIFSRLVTPATLQRNGVIYRRPSLTAGERFPGRYRFMGTNRVAHFRKHVLGLRAYDVLTDFPLRRSDSYFPDLRDDFERDFATAPNGDARYVLLANHARFYEARARAFLMAARPTILSFTRARTRLSRNPNFLTYRFDPTTGEFLAADTTNEEIVTYYLATPETMEHSNEALRAVGMPPVETPFEYFLSLTSESTRN